MVSCTGKRNVSHKPQCANQVYKCEICPNVGCNQNDPGTCTNQGFVTGRCQKCGGRKITLFRSMARSVTWLLNPLKRRSTHTYPEE